MGADNNVRSIFSGAWPPPPGTVVLAAERRKARPYLGSSVKNGFIRYSSVSQITLFDPNEEGGCPRKWAFQYVFGKKLPRVEALQEGERAGEKLEWWMRTGEDVLPPLLQPTKKFFPTPGPDLECEEFFGDIARAINLRELNARPEEIERLAGLSAAGVPLDGAADVRHYRGVYADYDNEGTLRSEAPGTVVAEILDQKTTKRIDGRWTRGRTTYLQGYAKSHAQVTNAAQMIGYGVQTANKHPRLTHVRLSHVYAQKDPEGFAAKRGGLVSVDELRERWRRGPDAAMKQMIDFAKAPRIEDVPANPAACSAYNHIGPDGKSRPGCGHVYYCPLRPEQVSVGLFNTNIPEKEPGMSLFDRVNNERAQVNGQVNGVTPTPPPAPAAASQSEADFQAEVTRQREKLLQEDALVAAKSKIMSGTMRLDPSGQVCDREGAEAGGWIMRWPTDIEKAAFTMVQPPSSNPVRPPDAPEISTLAGAKPVTDAQLAEVTDPELRARLVAHQQIHAEKDAATAATEAEDKRAAEADIWCPGGHRRITITTEMALQRKMTCQCGKKIALKPVKEGEVYVSSVPRHKLPKAEGVGQQPPQAESPTPPPAAVQPPAPPAPPTAPLAPPTAPLAPPVQVVVTPPAPPAAVISTTVVDAPLSAPLTVASVEMSQPSYDKGLYANGVCVLFDVFVEKGQALTTLEFYYKDVLRSIEKQFNVIDIRLDPNKSSMLAYAGWKAVLQHECRQKLPPPGVYLARSSNEIDRVVVEGIAESCTFIGHGHSK